MKKLFTALVFLCIGLAFAAAGCGKKETPKEEKAVSAEKGNEEKGKKEEGKEKEKEELGIVELSEEKQKISGIEVMTVSAESIAVPLTATAMIELIYPSPLSRHKNGLYLVD